MQATSPRPDSEFWTGTCEVNGIGVPQLRARMRATTALIEFCMASSVTCCPAPGTTRNFALFTLYTTHQCISRIPDIVPCQHRSWLLHSDRGRKVVSGKLSRATVQQLRPLLYHIEPACRNQTIPSSSRASVSSGALTQHCHPAPLRHAFGSRGDEAKYGSHGLRHAHTLWRGVPLRTPTCCQHG